MDDKTVEFILCAPIYAPGLVLILVALLVWGVSRGARKADRVDKASTQAKPPPTDEAGGQP